MKHLIMIIFFTIISFASEGANNLRVEIIEKIISEISIDKEVVLWSDNKKIQNILKTNNKLKTTKNCEDATIIILEDEENLSKSCDSKHIFVLNYDLLSKISKSFGALFWKKGRPNIVIIKPRITEQYIEVSSDLKPYMEDKIW
nr:hypothetical protein [uncultured Sulfurimonas sp.]